MIRSLTKEVIAPIAVSPSPHKSISALQAEVDQLKQQLLHAQKLANLGTMVGMLAHECNNLLTPMVTYGRFALDADEPALLKKGMEITLRQADVLMKMSDRLLGTLVQQAPTFQAIDLRKVLEQAVESLCRELSKDGIAFHNQVPGGLEVLGDPNALHQLFFNLLLNSRRALQKRRGSITVAATVAESGMVRVHFRDTGCGISEDRLPHIFDTFTTTKLNPADEPQRAAGLGLSICKMIVEDHRGAIAVESEQNLGTTFIIDLPTSTGQQDVLPIEKPKRIKRTATSRV